MSSVVSRTVRETSIDIVDVSESVMQSIQSMESEDGKVFTALNRSIVRRVLTDNYTPDLSEQILSRI